MFKPIEQLIRQIAAKEENISKTRKNALSHLADTLEDKNKKEPFPLIFICTHNSRRSIFAEVWANVLADYYQLPVKAYSGGTEVTAVHQNTLDCLGNIGFRIVKQNNRLNPKVQIKYGAHQQLITFSKLFDDEVNPQQNFSAIMLCDNAAENCPFIPNALQRVNLTFPDPKQFDDTEMESEKYNDGCMQIGSELHFLFRRLKME
jgi:protein-tyrosine-phosphatase